MAISHMNRVIHQLRKLALADDGVVRTDAQLLASFVSSREEAALETLVLRHGPKGDAMSPPWSPHDAAKSLAGRPRRLLSRSRPNWHWRHELIRQQLEEIGQPDPKALLRERVDASGLLTKQEQDELSDQVAYTRDFCLENRVRIATPDEEVNWLERSGLTP